MAIYSCYSHSENWYEDPSFPKFSKGGFVVTEYITSDCFKHE